MSALSPSASVLIKLGSLAIHVEEGMGPRGHPYDVVAIQGILADPELQEWLKEMDSMALLPLKRS